jgi:hypothetical protein
VDIDILKEDAALLFGVKTVWHHNLEEQNLTSSTLSPFMSLLKPVLEMMTFLS